MTKGFTLIELSIVLVIIGLLVGGVLVGKDLIKASELRQQITQLTEYSTAFNTFRTKYNCIPGDCADATAFFGTTDNLGYTITNGNGDGYIDTNSGTSFRTTAFQTFANSEEMRGVFQELSVAKMIGFIPSNPTSQIIGISHPTTTINAKGGLVLGASYNFASAASRFPTTTNYKTGNNLIWVEHCTNGSANMDVWSSNCAIFTASDLQNIDIKIDDGKPMSGKLFGFSGSGGSHTICVAGAAGSYTYDISYSTAQCNAGYVIN